MTTLHLGVVDVPYADAGGKTTGDVAEILEDKYHVMRIFFELHDKRIAEWLEDGLSGSLENLLAGAPPRNDVFGEAMEKIQIRFRHFLANKEMDALGYPGIPTAASLKGVSHRFKRPYKRRPARPSFIDTGAYQKNFKAWID